MRRISLVTTYVWGFLLNKNKQVFRAVASASKKDKFVKPGPIVNTKFVPRRYWWFKIQISLFGQYDILLFDCLSGRPLKGRNILGCSGAISLHLHFRILSGINRFQINETGFETGFQSEVLKNSRTEGSGVFDSCKLVLKLVYTGKYSEI